MINMEDQLKEIMADILDVDEGDITNEFAPESTNNWDSFNNLRLITAIEEEFEIKLSMDEIGKMVNFGAVKEAVSSHLPQLS